MPFQFTHPRGVRPTAFARSRSDCRFQFTHPRGVRLHIDGVNCNARAFQFTHPRGVRLPQEERLQHLLPVSIHAPARGATLERAAEVHRQCVSIHAPARGATERLRLLLHKVIVSIHAPARGATQSHSLYLAPLVFQFTHPRGVRHENCVIYSKGNGFNSRTREGCDISPPST